VTRFRRAFRTGFLVLLVAWPVVHMALSLQGAFSSWRFAGWGMYATPYPSARQHPIEIMLGVPGAAEARSRPLQIRVDGADVGRVLAEREGLVFSVSCSACSLSSLALSAQGAQRLTRLARQARQLQRQRALDALAAVVWTELGRSGIEHVSLRVRVSTRFARPLSNQYGFTHQDFSYPGRPRAGAGFDAAFTAQRGAASPAPAWGTR
jgi:hypothetical protein